MIRWEYRQIYADATEVGWMVTWPTSTERVETVLDRMGDEGWEAVGFSAVQLEGGRTIGAHYLFKRPRQGLARPRAPWRQMQERLGARAAQPLHRLSTEPE